VGAVSCPVVVGPTAVGKTGLIVELAARHPIEVISLDSRQIYRGLRIGTAQPSAEEQAACRHHLVDFVSPQQKYSAARFRADFERVFREIAGRGRVPILVGGAGLYLTSLRDGLFELPAGSAQRVPALRAELDALSDAAIRRRLAQVDPESAERVHANDRYRSQRALEVYHLAGRPMTELMAEQPPQPSLGLAFPTFYLQRDPAVLRERIAQRTAAMLTAGWIAETEDLLGLHPPGCPGLSSIGYREIVSYLQGGLNRDALRERIVVVTRQYAKRQRTWFRSMPRVHAAPPEDRRLHKLIGEAIAGSQDD